MINFNKMKILEPGSVLKIGEGLAVDENRKVYIMSVDKFYFKVGVIPFDNVSWFVQSNRVEILKTAKNIVFIEEDVFSIKHLTNQLDEFNALSSEHREEIIMHYCQIMDED